MRKIAEKSLARIAALAVLIASCVALTSCDDNDDYYYGSPLVGSWEQVYVSAYDVTYFTFYSDGTGIYSDYNNSWSFTWDLWGGNQVQIYIMSTGQTWNYQYRVQGPSLELYDLDYGGYLYFQAY